MNCMIAVGFAHGLRDQEMAPGSSFSPEYRLRMHYHIEIRWKPF